ncbi:MAG TPA: hypothetical protein DCE00_04505 [Firmicutes bacterium]|nr:hypothetical protein [Bacillota bacterium]HAA38114.1 hypothetical protein [Bacillota bacterium]
MEQICPYCNGLEELHLSCPACGGRMTDNGALQNILGPYAPYEENSQLRGQCGCIHQLFCPECELLLQLAVPQ